MLFAMVGSRLGMVNLATPRATLLRLHLAYIKYERYFESLERQALLPDQSIL